MVRKETSYLARYFRKSNSLLCQRSNYVRDTSLMAKGLISKMEWCKLVEIRLILASPMNINRTSDVTLQNHRGGKFYPRTLCHERSLYTERTVTNWNARWPLRMLWSCIHESIKIDQSKRRLPTPCQKPSIVYEVNTPGSFACCRFDWKEGITRIKQFWQGRSWVPF